MPKLTSQFVCQSCGRAEPRWAGRCPQCLAWNSLVEEVVSAPKKLLTRRARKGKKPQKLSEVKEAPGGRATTGLLEFNEVLGGGFIPGQVILLAGEPGIGKSTLLLQVASSVAAVHGTALSRARRGTRKLPKKPKQPTPTTLYISGEESLAQIKLRAVRLGLAEAPVQILSETDADAILSYLSTPHHRNTATPQVLIVDSIQSLSTSELASGPGSVSQVKECASRLAQLAKSTSIPLILSGHVTKEGAIAGPKVLEHLVDTVLYLEGDRFHDLRLLRSIKNRFGNVAQTGVFRMTERGLEAVSNPSGLILSERATAPGSALTIIMEGNRPLLLEVQALTAKTSTPYPRRQSTGLPLPRVLMLLAVLAKFARPRLANGPTTLSPQTRPANLQAKLSLQNKDVYVNVVGGFATSEPAADLAILLAIVSSVLEKPLPLDAAIFGEVGLSGEVRKVTFSARREREAKKLGFKKIISPENTKTVKQALQKVIPSD